MHEVILNRYVATKNSTIGKLYVIQNSGADISASKTQFMYTLEPRLDGSLGKPYAVPAQRYELWYKYSPDHGFYTPRLENVPGFEGVLIHPGNYPKDTKGCILVGMENSYPDEVGNSKAAYDRLLLNLEVANDQQIGFLTISNYAVFPAAPVLLL